MTAFVPGFDYDIFISYAHSDGAGWAQTFEERLGAKLKECLGVPVSIWQDVNGLRVGMNWEAEIEAAIRETAVFVVVLSPSYRSSEWCTQELDIFRQLFDTPEDFEKSGRFFKIIKKPYPDNGHLSFWPRIQHMDFSKPVKGPARFDELKPGSVTFDNAIGVLVNQSLAPILRQLRCSRERIFVASPAKDCRVIWKDLRQDLSSMEYDVRPEGFLGEGYTDDYIRDQIGQALWSIHLLGTAYDPFAQRQIQLAADLERRLMFWFAPGRPDAQQARLIEHLRGGRRPDRPELALPPGWDAIEQLTPRRFIEHVAAVLDPQQAGTAQMPSPGDAPRLYIVHDATTEEDVHIASNLQEEIEAQEDMEVLLSPPDQREHLDLLQTCEGVLLCRNAAPENWMKQMVFDVLLTDRSFPQAPLKSKALLVPDADRWSAWPDPNLKVFTYTPQFRPRDLEPFLAPLRAGGSASLGR